jgi:hypothetical protein
MKSFRIGLGLALLIGLLVGAAGGFVIGRGRQPAHRQKEHASVAVPPPNIATSRGAAQGSDRGAGGAGAGRAAGVNLAGLPPGEAWRRLLEIRDPAARADAVRALLDSMPPAQWPLWLAKMVESFKDEDIDDDDPEQMAGLFGTLDAVLQHMVATHPAECMRAMLALDKEHNHGDDFVEGLMGAWARHDPFAAQKFYDQEIAGLKHDHADDILKGLARGMAKADPERMLQWSTTLPDEKARSEGMKMAFESILKADRNKAISLLMTRGDLPARAELAEAIASKWAKAEPEASWEWAKALPADLRDAASRRAFEGWLRKDPDAARAAFDSLAPAARGPLLQSMVGSVPKEQIGALAEMLSREPVTRGRAEASHTLMRQWVGHDPTAATQWLAQQPPGQVQDHAIVGFLRWADGYEPQAALEWAGTISDPKERSQQLQGLVKRYRSEDPEMARTWVNSSTRLTADERARFLQLMATPSREE